MWTRKSDEMKDTIWEQPSLLDLLWFPRRHASYTQMGRRFGAETKWSGLFGWPQIVQTVSSWLEHGLFRQAWRLARQQEFQGLASVWRLKAGLQENVFGLQVRKCTQFIGRYLHVNRYWHVWDTRARESFVLKMLECYVFGGVDETTTCVLRATTIRNQQCKVMLSPPSSELQQIHQKFRSIGYEV